MLLEEKAFNFGKKILKLESLFAHSHTGNHDCHEHHNIENKDININEIKINPTNDNKRIIGPTDYKKFEDLAQGIENKEKEIEKLKEKQKAEDYCHLMGCNNDLRKEKQLMDKPVKEKIEASKRFKIEGDDLLKQKKYDEAVNIYEKGLLQLFYTFSDDKEEDELVDSIKENINLNCSFCRIKQEKFEEASQYLNEAMRVNKQNLKTLYRMAYCHYKNEKFDDAKKDIENALDVIKKKGGDETPFKQLSDDIQKTIDHLQNEQDNLLKKMAKKK